MGSGIQDSIPDFEIKLRKTERGWTLDFFGDKEIADGYGQWLVMFATRQVVPKMTMTYGMPKKEQMEMAAIYMRTKEYFAEEETRISILKTLIPGHAEELATNLDFSWPAIAEAFDEIAKERGTG